MQLVDTHVHINFKDFEGDLGEVRDRINPLLGVVPEIERDLFAKEFSRGGNHAVQE